MLKLQSARPRHPQRRQRLRTVRDDEARRHGARPAHLQASRSRQRSNHVATLSEASANLGNRGEPGQERIPKRHIMNLVSVFRLRPRVRRARPESH